MQVSHTNDSIVVEFTKTELLTRFTSEQYLCFRISLMMCEVSMFKVKGWFDQIKDQNLICGFLIDLLSREMGVKPDILYCSHPIKELVETRGIFGLINTTAAEFIKGHYDVWLYDLNGSSSDVITSESYADSETWVRVTNHGCRADFINTLIEKNMRDDEVLIVEFFKKGLI